MPWEPLTDDQLEIRELVRTIARERIAPRAAEIDESHEFPWDIVELYREHGLFGLFFDEAYGGLGTGVLLALTVIEEVSKVCASTTTRTTTRRTSTTPTATTSRRSATRLSRLRGCLSSR